MSKYWSVQVNIADEQVLSIESNYLSGRDLTDKEKNIVYGCGVSLINFVGRTAEQGSEPSEISAFVSWVASLSKTEYAAHEQLVAVIDKAQKLLPC